MYKTTHCALCGSKDFDWNRAELFPFVDHRMRGIDSSDRTLIPVRCLHCKTCGLSQLDRRYTAEEEARYYYEYAQGSYVDQRSLYEGPGIRNIFLSTQIAAIPNRIDLLRRFLARHLTSEEIASLHRVLDFGGGGVTVPRFDSEQTIMSTDISGKPLGDGVVHWDGLVVDIAISQQCFEHVSDVAAVWRAFKDSVRVGGWIYFEVPNEPDYGSVHIHEHINGWNQRSLEFIAGGLSVRFLGSEGVNWVLLAQRL